MVSTLVPHKKKGMYKFWLTIGVVSFLLVGCADSASDNEKQDGTSEVEAVQEEKTGDIVREKKAVNFTTSESEGAGQGQNLSASSANLNPAHGQPGHDCAIAVGAPLDGSGAQNQVPTGQPVVQPNLQVGAPLGAINPAHGQPGHDCAVPVGSPLPAK